MIHLCWEDEFEEENCQFCDIYDLCVLEPEEYEDKCEKIQPSTETPQ